MDLAGQSLPEDYPATVSLRATNRSAKYCDPHKYLTTLISHIYITFAALSLQKWHFIRLKMIS